MPNEPERDIEKTLKAYAKQRRDEAGAPHPLHPATRKMLRDEALRSQSQIRRRESFWTTLWISPQRFGLAAGVIAILAIGVWIMLPPGSAKKHGEMSLALNRTAPAVRELSAPTPTAPTVAPAPVTEERLADRDKAKQPARLDEPANKPMAAQKTKMNGTSTITTLADDKVSPDYKKNLTSDSLAIAKEMPASRLESGATTNAVTFAATPPPATYDTSAVTPTLSGRAGGGGGFGGAVPSGAAAEKYARVDGTTNAGTFLTKMSRLPVLTSFRLEQTNGQVRVIDADGSVYAGFVLQTAAANGAPPTFAAKDFRARAVPVAEDAVTASASAPATVATGALPDNADATRTRSVFFRVVGTNRSLNQSVLFTGSLQPGETPPAASLPIAGTGGKLEATQGLRRAPASPSRVTGRVVVGGTNEQDINAEATKP